MSKGTIIGIGNVLHQDDGIGVMMLKYLEATYDFPSDVSLIDGGTCGSNLARDLVGIDWAVILDAIDVKGDPGEVRVYKKEEFINNPSAIKMTPHQINFVDLLQQLQLEGTSPEELYVIGIIPSVMDVGTGIATVVQDAMPAALGKLFEFLKSKNVSFSQKESPLKPHYWWL